MGETASDISSEILREYLSARQNFGHFNSYHEGYAVIKEELDELWQEIRGDQNIEEMRNEAIQIGAMALSFANEIDKMTGDEEAYND